MSKLDEVNRNNLIVAQAGGVCPTHKYVAAADPEIAICDECGMKMLVTQLVATIERPEL